MELRDAHAKLRTSNEKLRREKERHDKERADLHEKMLNRQRLEHEHRNIDVLLQQIDQLIKVFPPQEDKIVAEQPTTPAPPRRLKVSINKYIGIRVQFRCIESTPIYFIRIY